MLCCCTCSCAARWRSLKPCRCRLCSVPANAWWSWVALLRIQKKWTWTFGVSLRDRPPCEIEQALSARLQREVNSNTGQPIVFYVNLDTWPTSKLEGDNLWRAALRQGLTRHGHRVHRTSTSGRCSWKWTVSLAECVAATAFPAASSASRWREWRRDSRGTENSCYEPHNEVPGLDRRHDASAAMNAAQRPFLPNLRRPGSSLLTEKSDSAAVEPCFVCMLFLVVSIVQQL